MTGSVEPKEARRENDPFAGLISYIADHAPQLGGSGPPNASTASAARFRPLLPSEFPPPRAPRLLPGLAADKDLILVYGSWASGKSFFTIDLAMSLACGELWQGRTLSCSAVVYVAGEAAGSTQRRVIAWLLHRDRLGTGDPPLGVVSAAPDLLAGGEDIAGFCEAMRLFSVRIGRPISLIVFDTLHACSPGSQENVEDMGKVLANVRLVQERVGCAALLVHHSGKEVNKGARGSSSLEAAADLVVELVEDGDDERRPIVRKVRDGAIPDLQPFRIQTVLLATDQGHPINSGVLVSQNNFPLDDQAWDDGRKERARAMKQSGTPLRTIAYTLGVSKSTLSRWLTEEA